jgi:hypothetical protein
MRKFKPLVAGQISKFGRRPVISPLDDGIMAVPIAKHEREQAHEEIKDFIRRQNKKKQPAE